MHPKRRFHLADKVRALEKLQPSSSAVFDVPKGVDVSVFVHALQKIQRLSLTVLLLLLLLLPPKRFGRRCLLGWIYGHSSNGFRLFGGS